MIPDGWFDGKVSDVVARLESGVSVNGEDRERLPSEKSVLKVSAVTYGIFDEYAQKVITNKEELLRARTKPKADQIIISRSNTEKFVGASAYIHKDYDYLFLPDKLWQTIPEPSTNTKWLSYILASKKARYTLSKLATGTSGTMKNITKGELLRLKILIPPHSEQTKIANILSTWDKAIETVEKLIENSRAQKKALMQKLLTGKKRLPGFSEEWKWVRFDEILNIEIGGTPSRNNPEYWDHNKTTNNRWLSIRDIRENIINHTKEHLSDLGVKNSNVTLIPAGSIIMSFKLTIGKTAFLGRDCYTNEAICALLPKNDKLVTSNFLIHALEAVQFEHEIDQAVKGKTLNKAKLSRLKINLPPIDEQNSIALVLYSAKQEIDCLQQLLAHLKQEKNSLMQQLLTGKRRVKTGDNNG